MASGPELFDALRNATTGIQRGDQFAINTLDSYDLRKLRHNDLVARNYEEGIAEEVIAALVRGDFGPLGQSMGLRLSVSPDAPKLLPVMET